jgi:hypothetical protein
MRKNDEAIRRVRKGRQQTGGTTSSIFSRSSTPSIQDSDDDDRLKAQMSLDFKTLKESIEPLVVDLNVEELSRWEALRVVVQDGW